MRKGGKTNRTRYLLHFKKHCAMHNSLSVKYSGGFFAFNPASAGAAKAIAPAAP
jgi:hypothetical protein